MKNVYLEKIALLNYRNFQEMLIKFDRGINIITGINGIGKTNILESISFLSPGKGLKLSNFQDLCKIGENSWKTDFTMQSKLGIAKIESFFSDHEKSRKIKYNGNPISSSEFANLLNVVWLTPQMETLFLGASADRRKFMDRIVYNFDKNHIKKLNQYKHYTKERVKFLSENIKLGKSLSNDSWIDKLEEKITESAKEINESRQNAINVMQEKINSLDTNFPKAILEISNLFDHMSVKSNFYDDYFLSLKSNRQKDGYSGRTNFGVHKSDMLVFHKSTKKPANLCSTGEQKALLISLILSSIESILENTNATPILLLDELFVHLDDIRVNYLSEYIISSKLQTFVTATSVAGIERLAEKAKIINL